MSTSFSEPDSFRFPQGRASPHDHQSGSWLTLLDTLLLWRERNRQRTALRNLADDLHLLDDLGLTREEVLDEANTPFWQGSHF
jgi:uncharacterized protein YjiS (DUF1127 family)